MKKTFDEILRQFKAGQYDPVYFLMGEEGYFIDLLVNWLENNALSDAEKGFNQMVTYGRETPLEQLLAAARRYPMMAPYQVVILREAQLLNAKELEPLLRYLKNPVSSTVLLIAYRGKKLDRKTNLYKTIEKQATVFLSEKMPDYKLSQWLRQYVDRQQWKADEEALNMLVEYLGNDLSKMVNALDKISFNFGQKPVHLTTHEVSQQVGISRDYNLLTLRQAVLEGNTASITRIVQFAEANPKAMPIQPVLPMLHRLFAQMWLLEKTPSSQQQAALKKANISPGAVRQLRSALPRYQGRLPDILHLIAQYSARAVGIENTSATGSDALLKELLFQLMASRQRRRQG